MGMSLGTVLEEMPLLGAKPSELTAAWESVAVCSQCNRLSDEWTITVT